MIIVIVLGVIVSVFVVLCMLVMLIDMEFVLYSYFGMLGNI